MSATARVMVSLIAFSWIALAGCFDPVDRRPGARLGGEVTATPADWSFTNAHREIAIEVATPYLLPHSVTIWCASLDGDLYVGARDPDSKRWPSWVDRDPDVRVGIGEEVYEVRLDPLPADHDLSALRRAYGAKYELPDVPDAKRPPSRYWRVVPRA